MTSPTIKMRGPPGRVRSDMMSGALDMRRLVVDDVGLNRFEAPGATVAGPSNCNTWIASRDGAVRGRRVGHFVTSKGGTSRRTQGGKKSIYQYHEADGSQIEEQGSVPFPIATAVVGLFHGGGFQQVPNRIDLQESLTD